jgi:GT2 family glycosyltransferase
MLPSKVDLTMILNATNLGFGCGNNVGIEYSAKAFSPDYVLLLNNDTIVDEGFLDELIKGIEMHPRAGIAGPEILFYDFRGRQDVVNSVGGYLTLCKGESRRMGFREIDTGQYSGIRTVDDLTGACLLVKSEVFEKVGLFDSDYFLYWEDSDLVYRARRQGYEIVIVPSSVIWHKTSASTGGWDSPVYTYYYVRNMFLFVAKNGNGIQLFGFLFYFSFHKSILILGSLMSRSGRLRLLVAFLRGVFDGMRFVVGVDKAKETVTRSPPLTHFSGSQETLFPDLDGAYGA